MWRWNETTWSAVTDTIIVFNCMQCVVACTCMQHGAGLHVCWVPHAYDNMLTSNMYMHATWGGSAYVHACYIDMLCNMLLHGGMLTCNMFTCMHVDLQHDITWRHADLQHVITCMHVDLQHDITWCWPACWPATCYYMWPATWYYIEACWPAHADLQHVITCMHVDLQHDITWCWPACWPATCYYMWPATWYYIEACWPAHTDLQHVITCWLQHV
jgi:hypothetical protein